MITAQLRIHVQAYNIADLGSIPHRSFALSGARAFASCYRSNIFFHRNCRKRCAFKKIKLLPKSAIHAGILSPLNAVPSRWHFWVKPFPGNVVVRWTPSVDRSDYFSVCTAGKETRGQPPLWIATDRWRPRRTGPETGAPFCRPETRLARKAVSQSGFVDYSVAHGGASPHRRDSNWSLGL